MAVTHTYERFAHKAAYAMEAIDQFAAARTAKHQSDPSRPIQIPPVLGDLRFFVTGRLSAPPSVYDPAREFISWKTRSGLFLFSGDTRTPDRPGTLTLGPGRYRWRIDSDYYQVIEFEGVWPPDQVYDKSRDILLLPGPTYPFPDLNIKQRELGVTLLRGGLLTAAGEPVKNVKIELTAPVLPSSFIAFKTCVTNAQGEWVLALIEAQKDDPQPDFAHSRIHVYVPGNEYDVDVPINPGTENSLRQTALRGRVIESDGRPLPDAKITTSAAGGESTSGLDGQWVFYLELRQGAGPVTVAATAADGRTGSQDGVIVPGTTVIVPAIELS